jgi:serine phosphatase RsbU (regulator of sigma subunit)
MPRAATIPVPESTRTDTAGPSPEEMEIAREVQACLLPRRQPRLETLEYASCYLPALEVGGDYYDFLENGPGHLGFALGDICGKSVSAALMMATLQATLRSQFATGRYNLTRLLCSVNELICECTASQHFAGLFLGDYDDGSRHLRYANCGHAPPLLVHADGEFERLGPTATVLGAFEDWECATREIELVPGDVLLMFTDGVSETTNRAGRELGERGLVEALRACRRRSLPGLVEELIQAVREFGDYHQKDDMTLVVARPR